MKLGILVGLCLFCTPAFAEDALVKYRGLVPLDTFRCEDVSRSSFIQRVCYDDAQQYMIINLSGTYYHYCEIGPDTVASLLSASSMGKFYNQVIKGSSGNGPFDCRTHQIPNY